MQERAFRSPLAKTLPKLSDVAPDARSSSLLTRPIIKFEEDPPRRNATQLAAPCASVDRQVGELGNRAFPSARSDSGSSFKIEKTDRSRQENTRADSLAPLGRESTRTLEPEVPSSENIQRHDTLPVSFFLESLMRNLFLFLPRHHLRKPRRWQNATPCAFRLSRTSCHGAQTS